METINKWMDRIDNFFGYISAAVLFIMMLWIFTDVVLRSFFNSPLTGTMEITGEYLLPIIIYFAVSYTQKHKGHVNFVLLEEKFPRLAKKLTRIFLQLGALAIFFLLALNNIQQAFVYFENNTRSASLLAYPLGPALVIVSLGIVVFICRLIVDLVNLIQNKDEKPQLDFVAETEDIAQ